MTSWHLETVFAEEWKARVDLAAIHRLCNNYCWNEGIQNHLTAAVPGRTDQFLIIAFGLLWSQVSTCDLTLGQRGMTHVEQIPRCSSQVKPHQRLILTHA